MKFKFKLRTTMKRYVQLSKTCVHSDLLFLYHKLVLQHCLLHVVHIHTSIKQHQHSMGLRWLQFHITKAIPALDLKLMYASETDHDPYEMVFIMTNLTKSWQNGAMAVCDQDADYTRKQPFNIVIKHMECCTKCNSVNKTWYASKEKTTAYDKYHLGRKMCD